VTECKMFNKILMGKINAFSLGLEVKELMQEIDCDDNFSHDFSF